MKSTFMPIPLLLAMFSQLFGNVNLHLALGWMAIQLISVCYTMVNKWCTFDCVNAFDTFPNYHTNILGVGSKCNQNIETKIKNSE